MGALPIALDWYGCPERAERCTDQTTSACGFDHHSRRASVSGPGNYSAAYGYTPDGLRIRAQESNHANPDRWFQYDGVRPVLEGTLSGDTWSTLARYDFEGNSYYDPLVYTSVTGVGTRHHLYDGLGSTRQLMAHADQSITDTYSYEAFGNLLGSTGSFPNPYRYVGSLGYYQTGSSLQHLGARYYLPEIGRLTSQDLAGIGNAYSYSFEDPVNYVDPEGLWGVWVGGLHLGDDRPWLVFDDSVSRQLKRSSAATAGGVARGITAGLWRPDWSDPCDPYAGFSGAMGTVGGGTLLTAGGLYVGSAAGVRPSFHPIGRDLLRQTGMSGRAAGRLHQAGVKIPHVNLGKSSHLIINRYNWYKPWNWIVK